MKNNWLNFVSEKIRGKCWISNVQANDCNGMRPQPFKEQKCKIRKHVRNASPINISAVSHTVMTNNKKESLK